jgi:hypothetical protein
VVMNIVIISDIIQLSKLVVLEHCLRYFLTTQSCHRPVGLI